MNYYVVETAKPNLYPYILYKHFACTLDMLVKKINYSKYIVHTIFTADSEAHCSQTIELLF